MVFFADPCHLGGKTIDSLRNCFLTSTDCQMIQWKITLQQIQNLAILCSLNSNILQYSNSKLEKKI